MNFFINHINTKYISSKDGEGLQIQIFLTVMFIIAILYHAVLAIYFSIAWNSVSFAISASGILLYSVGYFVNSAGKTQAASFMFVSFVTLFALVAMYIFGPDVGAQWVIIVALLPTILYFNFSRNIKIIWIAATPILLNIQMIMPELFHAPLLEDNKVFLKYFYVNAVGFGILIILAINEIISRQLAELRTKDLEAYKNMSNIDPLSKLNNRRYANIFFNQLSSGGQNNSCVLCLIDIDNFKTVNDLYGHDVGDIIIQSIADILRRNIRQTDLACRWGGDEFLIAICNCNLKSAQQILEKIRHDVEYEAIQTNAGIIKVTITGGAEELADNNIKAAFEDCDRKLYEGKKSGKNKIVI